VLTQIFMNWIQFPDLVLEVLPLHAQDVVAGDHLNAQGAAW